MEREEGKVEKEGEGDDGNKEEGGKGCRRGERERERGREKGRERKRTTRTINIYL